MSLNQKKGKKNPFTSVHDDAFETEQNEHHQIDQSDYKSKKKKSKASKKKYFLYV